MSFTDYLIVAISSLVILFVVWWIVIEFEQR